MLHSLWLTKRILLSVAFWTGRMFYTSMSSLNKGIQLSIQSAIQDFIWWNFLYDFNSTICVTLMRPIMRCVPAMRLIMRCVLAMRLIMRFVHAMLFVTRVWWPCVLRVQLHRADSASVRHSVSASQRQCVIAESWPRLYIEAAHRLSYSGGRGVGRDTNKLDATVCWTL